MYLFIFLLSGCLIIDGVNLFIGFMVIMRVIVFVLMELVDGVLVVLIIRLYNILVL